MDNPHDAQVEAFLAAVRTHDAGIYVQDVDNGEFIIDGVINVRAALDAAMAVERDGSAITTALEVEQPVAVEVKKLEWQGDGELYAFADVTQKAYSISFEEGKYWANWDAKLPAFPTLEAAKAAAQQDYETRIRSAIIEVAVEPVSLDDRMKAAAFDRIVASWKRHVDAVTMYNARRELANAERMRGSWAIKLDAEYHAMSDAQGDFHRTVQEACAAAISPRISASSAEAGGSAISTSGAPTSD